MKGMLKLLKGEMRRLVLYKILPVSLFTSLIWIAVFLFVSAEEAKELMPMLIFVDVSVMSVFLIGASHHLEKQEGVIKSMMIMPVSMGQILISKIIASMVLALESALVTSLALLIIHGELINIPLLLLFVVIAGAAHAAIGFFLALCSRDFSVMLGLFMLYMIPLTVPSILQMLGVINVSEWVLMITPSYSSVMMISAAVSGYEAVKVVVASAYLCVFTLVLLRYVVYPRFKKVSVRG